LLSYEINVCFRLDSGLVLNQQVFDTHYKASFGSTDYIDISAKYSKSSGNPSGNAKVEISLFIALE
jgi:hypothetical protein